MMLDKYEQINLFQQGQKSIKTHGILQSIIVSHYQSNNQHSENNSNQVLQTSLIATMHFLTTLAGLATFASVVAATPKQEESVGVAAMTYNAADDSTVPMNVPLGVLTHQNNKLTEFEIARVYSTVKGVNPPKIEDVTCQMFKDKYGTIPASKDITIKSGSDISKKPVDLGWILCRVNAKK
jgi:hypothetical protein